ncbi:MAG: hypothetical protein GXY03_02885 [Solirubrobacterales bacterium]|nr:hypothetical protein [Solirubrobacterales bacterium]
MEASGAPRQGTGWAAFAATMMLVVGTFNVIWGFVALVDDNYFQNDSLLLWSLNSWGAIHIVIGALQLLTSLLIFSGSGAGAVLGIMFAFVSAIGALLAIGAYPIWSVIIIVIDGLVIYALTVYGYAFRTD